ncbi:hypothetical protein PGN35_004035 [Nodosilinea sp. PGN35]|uniref:hypothetical protein n=1 Tax=Nodosilinea sp. PGN35 TaxID=3020489 RepID=UPI0023B33FA6|nr:hypothetical protein [Nodosilinea sp. TSF1-S3]MDF0365789.1 hypothetical protein [Nodosilinea sp. TSF1-S3]
MYLTDSLAMKGRLHIQRFDRAGQLINVVAANNAIVFTGRNLVAQLFAGVQGVAPITHLAVGTGDTAVQADTDTTLSKEVLRKPLKAFDAARDLTSSVLMLPTPSAANPAQPETSYKSSRIRFSADLELNDLDPASNSGQPYILKEAGLFNAAGLNTGVMYNRVVFPGIPKTNDFKLTLVWEILF